MVGKPSNRRTSAKTTVRCKYRVIGCPIRKLPGGGKNATQDENGRRQSYSLLLFVGAANQSSSLVLDRERERSWPMGEIQSNLRCMLKLHLTNQRRRERAMTTMTEAEMMAEGARAHRSHVPLLFLGLASSVSASRRGCMNSMM